MADEFFRIEDQDAVRMTWNLWPRNKVDAAKCVVPFAAFYTPVKPREDLVVVQYEPVRCKSCAGVLNLYAQIDFNSKVWVCPLCQVRNHFPSHYQGISPELLPSELFGSNTTMEYTMQRQATMPPVYIFVVDVSVSEDELEACKTTLAQALTMMPEHCSIGLVTFGTHVHVHELLQNDLPKSYVFRGSGDYPAAAVAAQLGVHRGTRAQAGHAGGRFIVPLGECEFQVSQALEDLQKDAFQAVADHRPSRCTGTALQVAAGLAACSLPPNGGAVKIMLFVGGPCTEGKAAIVPKELSSEIRSHKDLAKDAAPLWRPALRFYEQLSSQLVANSHSVDVFAAALEQSGLAEMKPMVQSTGGLVVQTDTFRNPVFKDSLTRVFATEGNEGFLGTCACGTLDVMCSRDIKVQGLLGAAASADKASPVVSSNRIGASGTVSWRLCSLDHSTTVCVVFDITADKDERDQSAGGLAHFFLQFATTYLHWDGTTRCRVTTLCRAWCGGAQPADMVTGFDQEAAACLMARLVTYKMESEEDFDANRWLDRNLIRLSQRFGEYRKDEPESFQMLAEMAFFPSFMFHLRRSQFVQVFGNSPDETAFARISMAKEHCRHGILMIQPQLFAFGMGAPPEPVPLDVASIVPDRILFLDTYFYIVVFHGSTIAQWRAQGYQEQPEYADFAALLREPQEKAQAIVRSRFPVPRFVDADNHTVQGRSQGRFLLVKLNPSSTHISTGATNSGEIIYTEDVSLEVFLEHLKKLAVQS